MAAEQAVAPRAAANENSLTDQDSLDTEQLARGVLARDFRPRVATVRRLAEEVLEQAGMLAQLRADAAAKKPQKKSAKNGKTDVAGKAKKSKKAGSKKRKLAKIPVQKGT